MQHAGDSPGDRRCVPARLDAVAARFQAEQANVRVIEERMEDADRVRAAADAGCDDVGQPPGQVEDLVSRLTADDRVEVTDHGGERVRSRHRAEEVAVSYTHLTL